MATFSIKAVLHTQVDTRTHVTTVDKVGEWTNMNEAYQHLTRLAAACQSWIIRSTIIPVNIITGELIKAPINLLPAPPATVCPLKDLVVIHPTRIPAIAIREPYTYKEDKK